MSTVALDRSVVPVLGDAACITARPAGPAACTPGPGPGPPDRVVNLTVTCRSAKFTGKLPVTVDPVGPWLAVTARVPRPGPEPDPP
jgi:hypothetical protein